MRKQIRVLSSEADRALFAPVRQALEAKGFHISEGSGAPGKDEIVLAVLTESFYADPVLTDRLLGLVGAGAENVLPLQLDGAPVPDTLKNALYSRNIIPAAGREPAQIAERIEAALPRRKSRLPLILTAGAVVLAAAAGLLIWRAVQNGNTVPAMAGSEGYDIVIPAGLTEKDLALVEDVVIVGDQIEFYTADDIGMIDVVTNGNAQTIPDWPLEEYYAYRVWQDDAPRYYSREDGREYAMTRHADLEFLRLLPNLRLLNIALAEVDAIPDLSGLEKLEHVSLWDCAVPDLEFLSGSSVRSVQILNSTGSIRDFSPLTGCPRLDYVHIDLVHTREADLSGFGPPALRSLWINNGSDLRGEMDLSGLLGCPRLHNCELEQDLPLKDLSFLANAGDLEYLRVENLHQLRDISALRGLAKIREMEIRYCGRIADFSPVAGCTALEKIHFQCDDNPAGMRDASFLTDLPKLRDVGLYGVELRDMEFLKGIADNASAVNLGFAGDIGDYSGLAYVKHYGYLHVNPSNRAFSAVLPYIENTVVDYLMLYDCNGVDLSRLPDGIENLSVCYGDIRDLTGLKTGDLRRLELRDCQYLSSLDGLENIPALHSDPPEMSLEILGCPRLKDFSALDGANLDFLSFVGAYTLPDLGRFHAKVLRLESMEELTDLRCLDALDADREIILELVGLAGINDLSPLRRLHGECLTVPPQVAEQAADLVEAGNFREFWVRYPESGWEPYQGELTLLSLDELQTLPGSLLRKIDRVVVAGDQILDEKRYEVREDWANRDADGNPTPVRFDRETGEETPLEPGVITDIGVFSELTGLRSLVLYGQPLTDLNGIQNLASLKQFRAEFCPELSDISALFALQEVTDVEIKGSAVSSLQGIQNLSGLCRLDITRTAVTDLTPLSGCNFTAACERGGLDLAFNELRIDGDGLTALSAVGKYGSLQFTNLDPTRWIPLLADSEIGSFGAAGDFRSDADLAAFAADHPELRSLYIGWNEAITDLTPLVPLEHLEKVTIHRDMREAAASLEGQSFHFELEFQD